MFGKCGATVLKNISSLPADKRNLPYYLHRMTDEYKTSVIVPIFKGKMDVMSCGLYRGVKLLEHAMKIVQRVLERRIRTLVNSNKMQFGFMPVKGTVDAIFIVSATSLRVDLYLDYV